MNSFFWGLDNYSNVVNYNTAYSKALYKYFFTVFFNKTIKKKYKLQIWKHNLCHSNIIAIRDRIILEKIREKKELLDDIIDTSTLTKVT